MNPKFIDLIKEVEGVREGVYTDSTGNPTVGVGFNLNDPDMRSAMFEKGVDPDLVQRGERTLNDDEMMEIKKGYYTKREPLVKKQVGDDLYDLQDENKRAALMSLGYQSLNNIGPNLRGYVAKDDDIGAIREIILNTNKSKDPGILMRRMREAEAYSPNNFPLAFETFSDEERRAVMDLLGQIKNENTRKQAIEKYSQFLVNKPVNRFGNLINKK